MSDALPPNTNLRGAVDLTALVNRSNAPEAGSAPTGSKIGLVFDGTDTNFTEFLELSMNVPIIVDLWAQWCEPCKQLSPIIETLIHGYAGRLVLVKVDVDANPQLTQAFQAQSIPTVAALIGGRPVSLFTGALSEPQVREVFEQVLVLAVQNGVTGTAELGEDSSESEHEAEAEAQEPPLLPLHQEAFDAIERGDYDSAITAYSTAIVQDPHDQLAVAGLAQVKLLSRLKEVSADDLRARAAEKPRDIEAQLAVADLDISGGHVEDAFDRLLEFYLSADVEDKNAVRERLLEFFEVVGVADPRVVRARARLTNLLY